jgi:hypothetical protein
VKLGSVVVDQADIVNDDVVDFPVFIHQVEFVIDGQLLVLASKDVGIDLRIIRVRDLACINDFVIAQAFNSAKVLLNGFVLQRKGINFFCSSS